MADASRTNPILLVMMTVALAPAGFGTRAEADEPEGPAPQAVAIEGVPHVRQRPDFCGEACAEMYLRKLGHEITQDDVFAASGLDPAMGRGCRTRELVAGLEAVGFRVGTVSHWIDAKEGGKGASKEWDALRTDLERRVPSIVCMRTSDGDDATEHFRLVLGHDPASDELLYHEPAETGGAYRRMKRERFLSLWPLKYTEKRWLLVRIPLKPGRIRPPARPEGHTAADFAQHVRGLKRGVPEGFTIVVQPPFVVLGDEPPSTVRYRSVRTVKWAVDRLKDAYFEKAPAEIIDVWLFNDRASYRKHTKELFGDEPDTPFGYFSHRDNALIMNIATGGGTLVHEIVHPYMRANFPACPTWFDEGLASLYEQSSERDGRIVGLTNWRLKGLQDAIRARKVPPLEELTGTTDRQFRSMASGRNYAQARYLCYYLQEKGLLGEFYHAFHKSHADDSTGYETLKRVLGEKDMAAFQGRWEQWVLGLRFP